MSPPPTERVLTAPHCDDCGMMMFSHDIAVRPTGWRWLLWGLLGFPVSGFRCKRCVPAAPAAVTPKEMKP